MPSKHWLISRDLRPDCIIVSDKGQDCDLQSLTKGFANPAMSVTIRFNRTISWGEISSKKSTSFVLYLNAACDLASYWVRIRQLIILVRCLAKYSSNIIFATCRHPEKAVCLREVANKAYPERVHIVPLDVTDEVSIKEAATEIGDRLARVGPIPGDAGLDYLVQNAAIVSTFGSAHYGDGDNAITLEAESFHEIMTTNVLGPALVMKHMHRHLKKSFRPVVVNVSSGLASIAMDLGPHKTSYSISKTALHMLTYKQAKACPDMIVLSVHPASVKTDMGTSEAELEPPYVAAEMIQLLQRVTLEDSGKFLRYDGELEAWEPRCSWRETWITTTT
ncbi:short chain dehydrogenase domain-containing protein [Rhizoctonia solani AG-1 IA]|uniref:Short chain dehydrogenase domain-containing protein n=1 Tax=Thanatephorus cucumeris (strain AG1-IA) TaxID=983506 RepID=L8WK87_THACA|nr:short chain dehydrogenase domain-containing protein [Rhizoctonia solani AG-1 IA]